MRKYWTEEELEFLKFSFGNKEFTVKEICSALDRGEGSVRQKAQELKLKRPKQKKIDGYKMCPSCKTILPNTEEYFSWNKKSENKLHSYCKSCMKRYKDILRGKIDNKNTTKEIKLKKCSCCNKEKPLSEFSKNKKMKDGYLNQCKECRYELDKRAYIRGGY